MVSLTHLPDFLVKIGQSFEQLHRIGVLFWTVQHDVDTQHGCHARTGQPQQVKRLRQVDRVVSFAGAVRGTHEAFQRA